jgi:hypothetical protein
VALARETIEGTSPKYNRGLSDGRDFALLLIIRRPQPRYVPEQSDGWTLEKKCAKSSPPQDSSGNRIVLYQLVKAS